MEQKWKRPLALLLSVAMMFSMSGTPVYAADMETGASAVCPHHVHDETCGYSEGTPCTHEHTDDCYTLVTQCVHEHTAECYSDGILPAEGEEKAADACTHVCSEESGCITKELNCPHVHDETCGYSEGSPCTFDPSDCELCNPTDSGEPEGPAECTCEPLCTADSVNPDCPVCAQDIAACQGETPAPEEARHWQFEENPDGFLIVEENGVFYADAPRGNIPLEAVVSMLPQSLTVEAEADGEPVTVAISGWECPDYQCVEDSWPQEGSYAFTAQVDTDLQLDPVPAVTLRLTNMVQTLAVNNPTLNLADGSIWIENGRYSQPSAAYVPGSYTQYTGTITITGTSAWGYGSVHITGSGDFNIVLKDANIKPGYTQEYSYSVTNGMEIREGANVTLTLEGTNSIKGTRMANEYTGGMDGLYVAESTLNIVGSGTLNVSGGDSPRLLSGSAGGDALDVYSSTVTIKDNVKVTLSGGNYSNHNNAHMEIIGNGINVTNSGTVILGGNSQVTAQGGTAISSYDAGSTVQINGGTHTFNACGTVVSNAGNNIENCQVMGGKATFHLFSSNGQFAPLYTNGDNGISVTGGVAVFYTDVNYTLSGGGGKVKLGANACILEGDKQNSASFVEKTTSAKTKTVNKKYVEVFFDTGENYHTLTVNGLGSGGTGGGKYLPGNTVTLYAGTKDGYAVRQWKLVSGEGKLSNANSPYASFIMYDSDTTVEVEFAKLYDLTVEDGTITNPTGQTQFISNTQVTLEAKDRTAENMIFDKWEIVEGSGTFQDAASANTTFTTGEANTKIRACYYKAYKLVVNGADGSGMYKEGAQVSLQPNLTLEDKEFSHWEVVKGTIDISDPKAANATFTMPAEDVEVTAVYDDVKLYGDYVVTVISGSESDFKYTGGTTNILDFTGDGEYAVRLKAGVTDTLDRIRIRSSSPTITITDLTIVNRMPFEVGSGNVTIKLDGVNTFQTTHRQPTYHDRYAAIQKGTSGTLTITSAQGDGSTYGTLNLSCGTNGAGIGGKGATSTEAGQSASNITINGGTLNINTQNGAGIGGGGTKDSGSNAGTADNITINGGNITITTTGNGAGIGGGGSSVSNADAGSASNITVNGGKLSIQCTGGSAIGGGQVKDGNDGTRGSATNIYVKNNPTKFDAAVAGSGSTTSLLDSLGADGKVDSNVKDFAKYGTVNIEYGNATVTAVKVQPDDALVKPGDTQQFTTQITGTGNWAVEWTVTGNADPATTINALGLLTVGANETAKSLTVTATISGTSISDSVTVTISKGADAMVTKAPAAVTGLTYTSEAQNLVAAGEAEGGTLVYSLEIDGNYDAAIPTGTNAGSYTVFYYVKGDAKHDDTAKEQVEVTINKAKPTVSDVAVSSPNTIYSDTKLSAITLTHTGTPGTVALDADQALTVGEGSYNWTFIPNDSNNYETTTGSIRLTVYEPPQEVDGVYQIDSVTDLFWFAGLVNGTLEDVEQDTAASAVLTADIDLSGETWTPIGNYDQSSRDENKYAGTFDGAGHTIEGLKIESSADWQGFVGYLGEGGVIENLTLGETCSVTGGDYVGGICGYTNGGTIESCTNAGTVTGQSDVGGICGLSRGTVTGCTNEGTVTGSGIWVGGVCGLSRGTVTGCTNEGTVIGNNNVGGVCGTNTGGTTENCANFGAVNGSGEWVGGVCGGNTGTITGCTNEGAVTGNDENVGGIVGYTEDGAIENCQNSGSVTGNGENVGGIVGYTEDGAIENCQNSGSVTGGKYTGAICGWNNAGTITGCTNEGAVNGSGDLGGICGHNEGTVKNCTNSGAVNNGDKNTVGGICGYSKTDVTGCTNSGAVTGKTYVGGIVGYTDDGAVETCQNSGSITGNGEDVGGICGFSNQPITNCANTGDITGGSVVGGVCGLMVSSKVTISNCYNTGTVTGSAVGAVYGKNGRGQSGDGQGTITNCYYQSEETTSTQEGATPKTADQFSSGEVCWLLNGSTSEGTLAWYQNLDNDQDKDTYPVLDSSHGIVYRIEEDPVRYSNDPNGKPAQVISVDITWGELSFTYSDGTWNPGTHEYDGEGWTVDEEDGNTVKVENNGNTAVSVSFTYTATVDGITGSFTDGENPVSEPVALSENGSSTVYLILAGKPEKDLDHTKIGSVTVTIGGENE